MILILSTQEDEHIAYVTRKLGALGAKYLWFDPADFPSEVEVLVSYERTGLVRNVLRHSSWELDLSTVTAVWDRRPRLPEAAPEVNDEHRKWVSDNNAYFIAGLWDLLDCLWVPGKRRAWQGAIEKTFPLALAAQLGFTIPRTLVTNSPEELLRFYSECSGNLVTKARQGKVFRNGESHAAFTQPIRRRDMANYRTIRYAPVTFQEYVPKRVELRVTVVGSQVFAAEIQSQANRSTRHDWRHYDLDHTPHAPHSLPANIEILCVRLVRALRLCFGAIDMIMTPDGEYIFLEINPNGQWAWIEDLTGLPISNAIAELLAHGTVGPAQGK
jgi:glutathione synthase/RimK-type ligase-like ATP-grasp enzyme